MDNSESKLNDCSTLTIIVYIMIRIKIPIWTGILSDEFVFYAAPQVEGRQRQANWCWAAAIQMVLNFYGFRVSQEEIVKQIFGTIKDDPANVEQILQALNGEGPINGICFKVSSSAINFNDSEIVHELNHKRPLIIGLKGNPIGHAYVLTAASYILNILNQPLLDTVVLRDPWPTNLSKNEVPVPTLVPLIDFVVKVNVAAV